MRHTRGFVNGLRRSASAADHGNASEIVIRLDPVGANLPEKRSFQGQTGDLTNNIQLLLTPQAGSGFAVNEVTALNVATVNACVALIANMVAKLPLYLYQKQPSGPVKVTDHPAIQLIGGVPCDLHTSFELRQMMECGKGLGGNGYARVYRDAYGDPYSIQWLAPYEVTPRLLKRANGEKFATYLVNGETLTRYDVIHVKATHSRDGLTGLSPITMLRESIGTSLAQTTAAGKLMKNGTQFPGFLTTTANLKKEQLDDARNEFNSKYAGAVNAGTVPVLNGQFDFKATNGMSMVDAQFVESRRFELQEIARAYGVPTSLIGDTTNATSFGTGIEQMTLGFLNFCMDAHLVGWEQSLFHTLLTTAEQKKGYYFKFDRDELVNVALEARANFYQTMRNIGVYSPNDIRRKMDEQTISATDGGDDYGKPFNASGGSPISSEKPPAEPVAEPTS